MLIILIGEMGMGKNFVGEMMAKEWGFHFFDGDDAIPPGKQLLHKKDVDAFVQDNLIPAITNNLKDYKNLIVAQALYFEEHRNKIYECFKSVTEVKFIHIIANQALQTKRLLTRSQEKIAWVPYAARSRRHFQIPIEADRRYSTIVNEHGTNEISKQIRELSFYEEAVKLGKPQQSEDVHSCQHLCRII